MTTKEWLSRAKNIDREIGRLLRERRKAYERCVSITSRVNATCVTGTKDPHKYDTLAEYEMMLDVKIDELYDTKREIQSAIWSVEDGTLRELLERKYIDGESLEQIAVNMKYSYRQTRRLHGRALSEIERCPTMSHSVGVL